MLYVAYGSNINKEQMKFRVPKASPCGTGKIYNWELAFHGNDGSAYATIVPSPGKKVPVVIWYMTDKDEAIMDRYEGYPNAYYKKKIPVHVGDDKFNCTVYIMNESRRVARPSRKYVNTVRIGYKSFGLNTDYLTEALEKNSRDFYLDDLMEVREFKQLKTAPSKSTLVKSTKVAKSIKKNGKKISGKNPDFKWKSSLQDSVDDQIPVDLGRYMCKTFPKDPYWSTTYGCEDDYLPDNFGRSKPSLDDYDRYDTEGWYPKW